MNDKGACPSLVMMVALSTTFFAFPALAQPKDEEPMMKTYQENSIDKDADFAE